jgi:hypothetical protein
MYLSLHVKYAPFLSDFNQTRFFRQIFGKYSSVKLHENSSSGNRVIPCGRADRQTVLIVAFRSFANALKIHHSTFLFAIFCLTTSIRRMSALTGAVNRDAAHTYSYDTPCAGNSLFTHHARHRTHYNV